MKISHMKYQAAIHWFRKGLRLHDNPALLEACNHASKVYPIFFLDPEFAKPNEIGVNRYAFLLESLVDLDKSLKTKGSRLYVVLVNPQERFPDLIRELNIDYITFESDTEPYALKRDMNIKNLAKKENVDVYSYASHTLHDMEQYCGINKGDEHPKTYQSFLKLFESMPKPADPFDSPLTVCLQYAIHAVQLYTV